MHCECRSPSFDRLQSTLRFRPISDSSPFLPPISTSHLIYHTRMFTSSPLSPSPSPCPLHISLQWHPPQTYPDNTSFPLSHTCLPPLRSTIIRFPSPDFSPSNPPCFLISPSIARPPHPIPHATPFIRFFARTCIRPRRPTCIVSTPPVRLRSLIRTVCMHPCKRQLAFLFRMRQCGSARDARLLNESCLVRLPPTCTNFSLAFYKTSQKTSHPTTQPLQYKYSTITATDTHTHTQKKKKRKPSSSSQTSPKQPITCHNRTHTSRRGASSQSSQASPASTSLLLSFCRSSKFRRADRL